MRGDASARWVALEVSRLTRSSADWHRLLELCGLADVVIIDEQAIYTPRDYNDRLLLGLKGQMSEAEQYSIRATHGSIRAVRRTRPIGIVGSSSAIARVTATRSSTAYRTSNHSEPMKRWRSVAHMPAGRRDDHADCSESSQIPNRTDPGSDRRQAASAASSSTGARVSAGNIGWTRLAHRVQQSRPSIPGKSAILRSM